MRRLTRMQYQHATTLPRMNILSIFTQNSNKREYYGQGQTNRNNKECLQRQENFWIKIIETLQPLGLSNELNP